MNNNKIRITAGKSLINFNLTNKKIGITDFRGTEFKGLMGITKFADGDIIIGANNFLISLKTGEVVGYYESLDFHHIKYINKKLIITCTRANQLIVLSDNNSKLIGINPPDKSIPVQKTLNYNHLNCICYYDHKYYVDLNWLTTRPFDVSGVSVLDEEFNEIDRFEYGWQTHGFTVINDDYYALCGANKIQKNIHHPNVGGLMVNGDIVYEIKNDWFCKDFSVDDKYIYIVGGNNSHRADRHKVDGLLIILDRKFNEIDKIVFKGTGECRGCLLNNYDYCDGYSN